MLQVQVLPLNASSGMRIVGDGTFQQTFNRDDGNYYPSYSSVKPLVVTVDVAIQDPDGVIPNGNIQLDRIDWYLGEYTPSKKISAGNANYEMAMQGNQPVLLIKRNTPVTEAFYLIGEAFYTNVKTGKQESRIEQRMLSSVFYEAGNFTLTPLSPTEVIIDPTKIDDSNPTNWHVALRVSFKSGNILQSSFNRNYFWYVEDGDYEKPLSTSYPWLVTQPSGGIFRDTIVIDASKITNLKIVARAAYRGTGEAYPTSPTDPSLFVKFNVRVDLPRLQDINNIPVAGQYISPVSLANNALIKQKCEIVAGGTVIDNPAKYYNITWKSRSKQSGEKIVGYGEDIAVGSKDIGLSVTNGVELFPEVQPKIGSWNVEGSIYNGIDAKPVFQYGTNEIANQLGAYLVKCEDGVNVEIVGKLKNNNWLRFEDGTPAPTIVNTPEEDRGYNIMYGWTKTIHTIDNAPVGDEYAVLFSEQPFEYNGVQSRPIPPTLICPGLATLVNNKMRSIYFKYGAGPKGSSGLLGINQFNRELGTYIARLSQFETNTAAVKHNSDPTKTIPFAPLMDWHLLNITNALMNKFGTVYLHDTNLFGTGISNSIPVENANYLTTTGIRYSTDGGKTFKNERIGDQPTFAVDALGNKKTWATILNNGTSFMESLETQIVLSYAAENSIEPDINFVFNGRNYRYHNIPGFKTLLEGEMNAKLIKYVPLYDTPAFDMEGNPITVHIQVRLQTSAIYGMDLLSADYFQYSGAGIEKVMTVTDSNRNSYGNPVKIYLCTDQSRLTLNTDVTKQSGELFDFETSDAYVFLKEIVNYTAVGTDLLRGTRIWTSKKGNITQNIAHSTFGNTTGESLETRVRVMHTTRAYAPYSVSTARNLYVSESILNRYGTGFQVRLPEITNN